MKYEYAKMFELIKKIMITVFLIMTWLEVNSHFRLITENRYISDGRKSTSFAYLKPNNLPGF